METLVTRSGLHIFHSFDHCAPCRGNCFAKVVFLSPALAPKTQVIYHRAWGRLIDFQERRGGSAVLPVPVSTLALFVTSMDLAGYAAPTIATSLSALSRPLHATQISHT